MYNIYLYRTGIQHILLPTYIELGHRWAQAANPLISEANIFISGLAVPLTFKNVNGLVIEANFF